MATESPANIVKNSDIEQTSDCENSDDETLGLYPNELAVVLQSQATTQSINRNPQTTRTPADAHPQEAFTRPNSHKLSRKQAFLLVQQLTRNELLEFSDG